MTSRTLVRSRTLAAAGLLAVLVAGDIAMGGRPVLSGSYVLAPIVASLSGLPRRTAVLGIAATAFAALTRLWTDYPSDLDYLARILIVAAVSTVAVFSAHAVRRVREARRRAALLAETGSILEAGLDTRAALQRLADILVPSAADWCTIRLLEDGGPRLVAAAHRDPQMRRRKLELDALRHASPESLVGRVIAEGEPAFAPVLPDATALAGAHDPAYAAAVRELGMQSAIVVPLRARGEVTGAMALSMAESGRRFTRDDVPFAQAVASRAAVALDAAILYERALAQEALLDTIVQRAPVGIAFYDTELALVRANEALEAAGGLPAAVSAEHLRAVLDSGEPLLDLDVAEDPDGGAGRAWSVSVYPVQTAGGRTIGVGATAFDLTERNAIAAELRTQRDLYETMLASQSEIGEGFAIVQGERVVYANDAASVILGSDPDTIKQAASFLELVDPSDHERILQRVAAAYAGEPTLEPFELLMLRADGSTVEVELSIRRLGEDEPPRLVVLGREITSRKRAEREREAEYARAAFLASAGELLEASLGSDRALGDVAALITERIAAVCEIDVLAADGSIRRVGPRQADARRAAAQAAVLGVQIDPGSDHPIARVIRTGEPQGVELGPAGVAQLALGHAAQRLVARAGVRAGLVLPLLAHGRVVGALTLGLREGLSGRDRELVAELARRIALALDNARLYEERARVARTLQSSLLPAQLPAVAGLELAARYQPASGASEVGGDFYDVIVTPDGRTVAVVGDVCGKGTQAAALTALARHTLRAAVLMGKGPAGALHVLNRAILASSFPERFCTAVVAELAIGEQEIGVLMAIGGHPRPLLRRSDGAVEQAGAPGTLVGIFDDPEFEEVEVRLAPGDALSLFTDGLVEARTDDGLLGHEGLARVLGSSRPGAAQLAGALAGAVSGPGAAEARDDIAVLVLAAPVALAGAVAPAGRAAG